MLGLVSDIFAVRVPPRLRVQLGVDVNVFGLAKLVQSLRSEFAGSSGRFHPAEGSGLVVRQWVVEPDGAGLDLLHRLQHVVKASGVDVRPESVLAGVRALDRFVQGCNLRYRGNG